MFSFFRKKRLVLPAFSAGLQQVISTSRIEALRLDNDFVAVPHLLLAMLREEDVTVVPALEQLLVSPLLFEYRLASEVAGIRLTSKRLSPTARLPLTVELEEMIRQSYEVAAQLEAPEVEALHLLLPMLRQTDSTAALAAGEFGLTHDVLVEWLRREMA
jgi:ATP-dependent Clp protease ATP-binding subunit ClpA